MKGPGTQLKGRAARLAQVLPAGNSSAARTPFVLLVVLLLGGGLIALLLLNSALSEGSFRLTDLKKRTTDLTDEQQALQRDVDDLSAPYALERRARELGMVPGGSPAFLDPDGTVRGAPGAAPTAPGTQPSAQFAPQPPAVPSTGASAGTSAEPSARPSVLEETSPSPVPASGTPAPTTPGR